MQEIATGANLIDLVFLGYPEAIGPCLLESGGELALLDCGPSNCLPTLRQELAGRGLSVSDLTSILLTHIHLDHAGAAGSLVRENPKLRVYVHEKGAPHLADPTKLLRSAERLYHGEMHQPFRRFSASASAETFMPWPVARRCILVRAKSKWYIRRATPRITSAILTNPPASRLPATLPAYAILGCASWRRSPRRRISISTPGSAASLKSPDASR